VCLLVIVACVLTAPRNWSPSTTDTANFGVLARPAPLVQASQVAGPGARIGVGGLGFRVALRQVLPDTREQPCWFHKIANVLNALPRSAQRGAKAAPADIWNAKEKEHARGAAKTFAADYASKCPKATAKVTDDLDVLLAFFIYDYRPEHWIHLHTTRSSPPFTTVRLRH
jgi:hypothetical protein